MRLARQIVGLLLVLAWLPCTVHCQAEALGWLGANPACCDKGGHADDSSAPDCSDCATCSAVESGGYSLPEQVAFVQIFPVFTLCFAPDLLAPLLEPAVLTLPAPDSSPQFLAQSWSFRCRTASAPRAPSLLA